MTVLRLKDLREDRDLKQEDVARVLGISRQYYSRYEQGQVELPIRHYVTLAKFYNVTIDFICGLSCIPRPLREISDETLGFTKKERQLIERYNKQKNMQAAIDKILDL